MATVTTERPREAGPVHVGLAFWRRLGLDARGRRLTWAMTLNRLIAPASEPAVGSAAPRSARAARPRRPRRGPALRQHGPPPRSGRGAIEAALAARERSLFNLDPAIYLYDLTSTYFEGQALANPKARRGTSRDKRPDCKQVLIALAIGREGFPLGHEILAGNTRDPRRPRVARDRAIREKH